MKKSSGIMGWIDARFPATKMWKEHLSEYYAPKNFNFWYFFGSLALVVLVNQLLTGIWLAMFYKPSAQEAFASIEYINRDVTLGWLLRNLHECGASFFFIVVYCHMFRGLLYGSYKKTSGAHLADRHGDLRVFIGRSLYGVFVTLGANVALGSESDHFII